MKNSCILLISLLAIGFTSCNSQNKTKYSYEDFPLKVTDEYKKVWMEEFSNDLGTFYVYKLKKPKVIQSYPVKGRFYINSEGKLTSFTLAKDHVINGTLIPKGSWYEQNIEEGDGYAIQLAKDITIKNFPVYHKQRLFSENSVSFHKDGTLLGFSLANDMHIDNIPCNGTGKNRRVELYHNQNLRFCHLSENHKINNIPCQGGEEKNELWLYQNGNIISCILSTDFELSGRMYAKGSIMIFDEEGKVHYLTGQVSKVNFYEDGQVERCYLESDLEINGKLVYAGSKIVFNKTGEIKYIKE